MRTSSILALATILVCCPWTSAQTPSAGKPGAPPAAKAPEPSREAVEKYVTELTALISTRETSVTRLINQITAHDRSIQEAVEKVLQILTASKDTLQTYTKVTRLKEETVAGLKRAAEAYEQKRRIIAEDLRTTKNEYLREDLFKSRGVLDSRIDKMIEAMVNLALSMEVDEGHEKYIQDSSIMLGVAGIAVPSVRRNPEYDQNKRQTERTRKVFEGLDKDFADSQRRLDVQERDLAAKLANPALSEEEKDRLGDEIERVQAIKKERSKQRAMIDEGAQPGPQTELGRKEVMETEELIDNIAAGARREFLRMMTAFNELRTERQSLDTMKAKLDHASKWLESHPAVK